MHTTVNDLGLTDGNSGCHCSTAGHTHEKDAAFADASATEEFLVIGMTCSHCVSSVQEEISAIDGVDAVSVELHVGGESRVTVASNAPVDPAAVRAAVEEAGYSVVTAH